MTTTIQPYKLDSLGFPAIDCPKCKSTGNLPHYSNHHQGVCFRCGGTGLIYPTKKIADEATRYHQQIKDDMRINGSAAIDYNQTTGEVTYSHSQLTPGRVVRTEQCKRGPNNERIPVGEWRTVATYRRTALIISEGTAGDHWHTRTLEGHVTFTDGTRETVWCQNWQAQPTPALLAEVAASAAACRAHYERTLTRRAGRPGDTLDADTRRIVTAARDILDSDADPIDKLVSLARLYDQKRTSTAARGVRDHIRSIHRDRSHTSREAMLTAIAAYINDLTGSTK